MFDSIIFFHNRFNWKIRFFKPAIIDYNIINIYSQFFLKILY